MSVKNKIIEETVETIIDNIEEKLVDYMFSYWVWYKHKYYFIITTTLSWLWFWGDLTLRAVLSSSPLYKLSQGGLSVDRVFSIIIKQRVINFRYTKRDVIKEIWDSVMRIKLLWLLGLLLHMNKQIFYETPILITVWAKAPNPTHLGNHGFLNIESIYTWSVKRCS